MLQKKEKPSRNQLNAHAPHIQEQCQQLICLNAGGTAAIVGSWCLVPAGHGSLLQLQSSGWAAEKLLWSRREGMALPPHTLLPPPVSGCLPHIPPEAIMGNDAKRGAWMGQTNYRDNRQRATWGPFPWWGRKYELDIHELSQGPFPPAALYIQLRRTAKQNGSKNVHWWKNCCPPFIKPPIVLSFVAEIWHCEDTFSRPWIQSQLLARLDKAFGTTACIWGPVRITVQHCCHALSDTNLNW